MKILALEFSSLQRSVAVAHSGQLTSEVIDTVRGHAMRPLGLIEEALKQAGIEREQIECIALGLGPGSYTGIRAAIALGQGWQLARGVKLLGISSAECVVAQAREDGFRGRVSVVIDAQRGEFYLGDYEIGADAWREIAPLRLVSLAEVRGGGREGVVLIGPEVARWFPGERTVFPRAAALGKMALGREDFVAGAGLKPIYLREVDYVKARRPGGAPVSP